MHANDYTEFREKLESSYSLPALYMFKFIVSSDKEEEITNLFPKNEVKLKSSKTGKYISLTAEIMIGTADQVIVIYKKAHTIEGLIAL